MSSSTPPLKMGREPLGKCSLVVDTVSQKELDGSKEWLSKILPGFKQHLLTSLFVHFFKKGGITVNLS